MSNVTGRRPFSGLGDQQLLDQTRRLVANQRCLEVHLIDHLDEIDRRGLALRRGYSSLFDYVVRELGFTDASAQRRIQTMRLCRRHRWVRAKLKNGKFDLTSAALLETAIAGAEREGRQGPGTGRRRRTRPQDAGGQRPAVDVGAAAAAATDATVEQVAELCAARPCAPPSALAGAPAPTGSPGTGSLPPGLPDSETSSAAPTHPMAAAPSPLLDPQRQRELIEQAADMSTRQVAGLIAAAAPEVVRPRDTLRAVAADRYTLKVNIDAECERGLRRLKDLLSHRDPRMSWGDLVAHLVREAVTRHDPRGEARGRRRASRDGEPSPRRPETECAAGATATTPYGDSATPAPQFETVRTRAYQRPVTAAHASAPAPKFGCTASAEDAHAAAAGPGSPIAAPAPQSPQHAPRDDRTIAVALPEWQPVPDTRPDGGQARAAAPSRRAIPAAVRRLVWERDEGRCCYRDPMSGRRCASSHLIQIDHLLPVAQGGNDDPDNLRLACFAHHRMRHRGWPAP